MDYFEAPFLKRTAKKYARKFQPLVVLKLKNLKLFHIRWPFENYFVECSSILSIELLFLQLFAIYPIIQGVLGRLRSLWNSKPVLNQSLCRFFSNFQTFPKQTFRLSQSKLLNWKRAYLYLTFWNHIFPSVWYESYQGDYCFCGHFIFHASKWYFHNFARLSFVLVFNFVVFNFRLYVCFLKVPHFPIYATSKMIFGLASTFLIVP